MEMNNNEEMFKLLLIFNSGKVIVYVCVGACIVLFVYSAVQSSPYPIHSVWMAVAE